MFQLAKRERLCSSLNSSQNASCPTSPTSTGRARCTVDQRIGPIGAVEVVPYPTSGSKSFTVDLLAVLLVPSLV